jgi:hypothetical protein
MAGGPHSPDRSDKASALIEAVRTEILAEAQQAVVVWLAKKAQEQPTWEAKVLASKVDRGAVRIFADNSKARGHHFDGRLGVLLDAIRTHGGEWTTRRVVDLYRAPSIDAANPHLARRDLHALYALGHLIEHDLKGRRHYTLATRSAL